MDVGCRMVQRQRVVPRPRRSAHVPSRHGRRGPRVSARAHPDRVVTDRRSRDDIDDVVHQRHRLGVMVVLAEAKRADFAYLKKVLELTDGNLGRHLQVLEKAGYVELDKVFEAGKPRTWVTLTKSGRSALSDELDTMERFIRRVRKR